MRTLKTIAAACMLLGATSVMAQNPSDGGDFIFKIPDAFVIECDDSHGTIDAIATKDVTPMIVPTESDLETAEAYISCRATSTLSKWKLNLTATNGGKMKINGGSTYLQLTDNVGTANGVLGMAVLFTKSFKPGDETTLQNDITTENGLTITTNGVPSSEVGIIRSYPGAVNLADALDPGSNYFEADASTGFEFEIHAAFVNGNAYISSPSGTYTEHINIEVSSAL